MIKAVTLLDWAYSINERYRVEMKVLQIPLSEKFPEGVKVSFVLIDYTLGQPKLILDNHAPYGYHIHTQLPESPKSRIKIDIKNYTEAIQAFNKFVVEILKNEN